MPKSVFAANAFDNVSAQIPDLIRVSTRWELKFSLAAEQNGSLIDVPDCRVTIRNMTPGMPPSSEQCSGELCLQCGTPVEYRPGALLDVVCNDSLEIVVNPPTGYFPAHFYIAPRQSHNLDTVFTLSPHTSFTECDDHSGVQAVAFREKGDRCILLASAGVSPAVFAGLTDDFNGSEDFRDFAVGSDGAYALGISVNPDRPVTKYAGGGRADFTLHGYESINSPEGITIDAQGNMYLTDWGHGTVAVFDGEGRFQFAFATKEGHTTDAADPQLLFPTRIALEEDRAPLSMRDGRALTRETHIWVADGYGIHRFDSRGRYLDTPITTEIANVKAGTFYEFAISGYGEQAVITLVDRKTGEIRSFCPK